MIKSIAALLAASVLLPAGHAFASSSAETLDLTAHGVGLFALAVFCISYLLVMAEEFTHLRKSKPVLLASGIIWGSVAYVYSRHGLPDVAAQAVRHNILEFAELLLFLLVAMTYINAMQERLVFDAIRARLVAAGHSARKLFWVTGALAFVISPIADNLTTALLLCAVAMAIGQGNAKFISLSCINIVVAANAGGAFSPFGDITTLMVWQKGMLQFWTFFKLFVPALVNWLVPALLMSLAVPALEAEASTERVSMKRGAIVLVVLFLLTICTSVGFHNFLHMPPVLGMMTGLAYLKFYGYYLRKTHGNAQDEGQAGDNTPFDVFESIARAEWDTLMFFYGVILCVGGLGFIGYLTVLSDIMYVQWGATNANILVGLLSAVVDNIPVMFAVLSMSPEMSEGQWLLVTLTAGVGGSLLSIGSAAGVALMGQARGAYTFFGHLKWTPAIALGYAASIYAHFLINASTF